MGPVYKKIFIIAALTFFSIIASAFEIVKDGRALCVIVTPDNPGPVVMDAVRCLKRYIKKISGVELKVVPESEMPSPGNMIVLGNTRCARGEGIDVSEIKCDGFIHKVKGRRFFIAGPDRDFKIKNSKIPLLQTRKDYWADKEGVRGTLNGVICFLHDYCGVRWFIPTPKGERIPISKSISVPDGLNTKEEPPFEGAFASGTWVYFPGFYWAMANSFRITASFFPNGGHFWDPAMEILSGSPEKLFREHPEYFYYKNGVRRWKEHGNYLCTSNAEVQDYLSRALEEIFSQGWNIVQYGQSDGYSPLSRCECDKCEAMDEYRPGPGKDRPCERLLVAFNEIAKKCYGKYPNRKILMPVYGPTVVASEKIAKFPPNVLLQVCSLDSETLDAWRNCAPIYLGTLYWLGNYQEPGISVKSTPDFAAKKIRFLHRQSLKVLFWSGVRIGENWGNEGPVYYLIGQLLRNPSADCDKLLNEYYDWVYAEASGVMKRYFALLYGRLDKLYLTDDYTGYRMSGLFKTPEEFFTKVYTPAFLLQLEELLKEARKLIKNENSGKWLALTIDQFEYIKTTANVFHKYKIFRKENDIKSLNELKQAVEARRKYIKRLKSYAEDRTYIRNWYPGYKGIVKYASVGGKMRGELRAPFNWNFDKPEKLLEKSVETVLGKTSNSVVVDGKLDEPAWNGSSWNSISGRGSFNYKTGVKLTYDNDNLYLGFECEEPDIEKMKIKKRDVDGRVWRDECVEIFLNPEGCGDKYMHFALNPEKGCFYDARKGYIDDPLHPLFNTEDAEWNVDWNYAYSIDKKNKKWILEIAIPFKSLGVSVPLPGTVWKGNFARKRWLNDGRKSEAALWSPNFKSNAFNSSSAFGSIRFGNLFENPGFEEHGDGACEVPGWLCRGAFIEKGKVHSGNYAVELKAASEVKGRQLIFARSLPIKVSGGGKYRVAAWIDIPEDLVQMPRDRRLRNPGFNIIMRACDETGKHIRSVKILSRYRKTEGWIEVSGECELPAETEKVLIFFILREYKRAGKLYIDDVSFVKTGT